MHHLHTLSTQLLLLSGLALGCLQPQASGQSSRPSGPRSQANGQCSQPAAQRQIRDAKMFNLVSHNLTLPRGFHLHGSVLWPKPGEAHFAGHVEGPQQQRVEFVGAMQFSNRDKQFAQLMTNSQTRTGSIGSQICMPRLRPDATQRIVRQSRRFPAAERIMHQQLRKMLLPGATLQTRVESVLVRYRQGTRTWDESIDYLVQGMVGNTAGQQYGSWFVLPFRVIRAPAGQLEAQLPRLQKISDSLRATPTWCRCLAELKREIILRRPGVLRPPGRRFIPIHQRLKRIADGSEKASPTWLANWRQQQQRHQDFLAAMAPATSRHSLKPVQRQPD